MLDKLDMGVVVLGLATVIFSWVMSIRLARKKDIYTYDI